MLYYDRIDLSEKIDVAKSNGCNGCHDLKMLCLNLSDIAIITIKCVDYCCIFHDISRSEVLHLLESFVLDDHGYI